MREGEENGDKMNCNDYFYIKNRTVDEIMRLEIQSHKACQWNEFRSEIVYSLSHVWCTMPGVMSHKINTNWLVGWTIARVRFITQIYISFLFIRFSHSPRFVYYRTMTGLSNKCSALDKNRIVTAFNSYSNLAQTLIFSVGSMPLCHTIILRSNKLQWECWGVNSSL